MFVSWSTGNASIRADAGEAAHLQDLACLASTVCAAALSFASVAQTGRQPACVAPSCLLGYARVLCYDQSLNVM